LATKTSICNLALAHLGQTKYLSNIDTDTSVVADVLREFYDLTLKEVIRDFKWPFCVRRASLALIGADPNAEWGYAYRYPSDCESVDRVLSGVRNDTRQSRISYKIEADDAGKIIYCDQVDAEIEYSVVPDDPEQFPPDFALALSFKLATYVAPAITAGDPFKLGDRAMSFYRYTITNAMANSKREEQVDEDPQSEYVRGRE
jgi:hypothetical protein